MRFLSLRPGVQGGGMQMCILRFQEKLLWNKSLGNKIPICLMIQLSYFLARSHQQHNTLMGLNPKKKYPGSPAPRIPRPPDSRVIRLRKLGPVYMEKSCPGQEGHPPNRVNFTERLYEKKVDPSARAKS